jgi:WD40-like Beta Propeller Repeat
MKRAATPLAMVTGVLVIITTLAGIAFAGPHFSDWATAQKVDEIAGNSTEVNTPSLDGCPIQSPDGLSLYMASNRPRFVGDSRTDLDIWVAHRATQASPWGAPQNLGEPVNSLADDFCPTPIRGGDLFFVSREALPGACGMGDIYLAHSDHKGGFREPQHLACGPAGPNSALDEQGPSYVQVEGVSLLYFSSGPDIYVSEKTGGSFGPAASVAELNTASSDIQPNLRKDGLEVVFASNRRAGTDQDIYVATRASIDDPFSGPVMLSGAVNTTDKNETRPSLSWDAQTLHFGRTPGPEGSTDIYVTTRDKL